MPYFTIIDKQLGSKASIGPGSAGEASETWIIMAADGLFNTAENLRNAGLWGEPYTARHPTNSDLILQPVDVVQSDENPMLFTCTLTWKSPPLSPTDPDGSLEPLDRRPRITVKSGRRSIVRHRDYYGVPKVNKAGDLFDPPIEAQLTHRIISIRKNVVVFPDWVFDFDDAINSTAFMIKGRVIPAHCAYMAAVELGEPVYEATPQYCEARIEIHVSRKRQAVGSETAADIPSPWDTEQLNEGLHRKVGTAERERIRIKDANSDAWVFPGAPVPLDADGQPINPITDLNDLVFLKFRDHPYLDFNLISFLWNGA